MAISTFYLSSVERRASGIPGHCGGSLVTKCHEVFRLLLPSRVHSSGLGAHTAHARCQGCAGKEAGDPKVDSPIEVTQTCLLVVTATD